MITIDFTEQVIEAERNDAVDVIARLVTCGLDAASDVVRFHDGPDVDVDLANRVSSPDRPDYVVRERSLFETGSYEVISNYRGGHARRFILTFEMKEDVFEIRINSDEKTMWLFENEPHVADVAAGGGQLVFRLSLDPLMQQIAGPQVAPGWTEEEVREGVIRERYDSDKS